MNGGGMYYFDFREQLFESYGERIYNFCLRHTDDSEKAIGAIK